MRTRARFSDRSGFGVAFGFVLIVVAIASIIILGADFMGRGSRLSMERSFASSRAAQIALNAIDEGCRSREHSALILDMIHGAVKALLPSGSPVDYALQEFLGRVAPRDSELPVDPFEMPGGYAFIQKPGPDAIPMPGFPERQWEELAPGSSIYFVSLQKPNTVYFKNLDSRMVEAKLTKKAHVDDPSILNISDVEIRPILFSFDKGQTFAPAGELQVGDGLLRARARVTCRIGGFTATRSVCASRFFQLWSMNTETEVKHEVRCHGDFYQVDSRDPGVPQS